MITRQNNHLEFTNPYPNCTLTPQYDLTGEIFATHSKYKIQARFCHVKEHQDDNQDNDGLSLSAKLDVYADKLAMRFYIEGQPSKPKVYDTPSHKTHLLIEEINITNDYNNQLLRAHTEPQYIKYLQDKFDWDIPTDTSIHWKALKNGLRQIQHH